MASHRSTRPLALVALGVVLLACDPNVVIGAKWRLGGEAGSSAGTESVAGSGAGGSGATGGVDMPEPNTGGSDIGGTAGASEAGAGGEPGSPSHILFEATHEQGSLAEWDEGPDMDAGGYYADATKPVWTNDVAHSGTGSIEASIDTSTGTAPIARLYRRIERVSNYYSAWFYLNEDHTPGTWWSIFLFRAHQDRAASIDLWDVDLIRVSNRLSLSVYDHQSQDTVDVPTKPVIPVKQWFQLEAYLEFTDGQPSKVDYWLDGAPILTITGLKQIPPAEPVYWLVGNGGSLMTPAKSTVYIDDAIVSTERIGP